ncbi:hypothetical protein ASD12_18045 [Mesorhizobium sp. Root102]|uniref:hypothetical protein n=1 Tax=Mesorhizobium sp. Root102 TaxID=1736422 RepID=UPI0006FF21A8|nr:hypothetical protein [Mesorhizobium sp. Root102]KQU77702.1 hypothetical protein ASD12_18045 [Mesorhizobium sp. Root102]
MDDLLDLGPAEEVVSIRGKTLLVRGVPSKGIIAILRRFPDLASAIEGGTSDVEKLAALVMAIGGDVIVAIIVAGLGKSGEKAYEDKAETLPAGDQFSLILATLRTSFPNGLASLAADIRAMRGASDAQPAASATRSRKRSST